MTDSVNAPAQVANPARVVAGGLRRGDPSVIVIFGSAGDLSRRKLFPALFHLAMDGALPDEFAILGIDREEKDDAAFRAGVREAIEQAGADLSGAAATWTWLESRLFHLRGDFDDPATYAALQQRLIGIDTTFPGTEGHLFYLAIPPSLYTPVITHLSESGVLERTVELQQRPWRRVVIEKPFGRDLASAKALNATARSVMAEHQIYRIDHYLGKETVQNLLVLRFANSIFEPVWNRHHIHHVQITTAEEGGIEHRGAYYEEAGVVRDMFQNHLLQLLALTAMEPATAFRADAVRDEKVKVLRALRSTVDQPLHAFAVRGQYGPGVSDGVAVPGYRQEEKVTPGSVTPTFAAVRFMIDNWRWHGVPFFLRSGKRLPKRASEIAIQFRKPPHLMFPLADGESIEPNVLAIQIQPSEGISLRFEVKVPGLEVRMASVKMDFTYAEGFGSVEHDAYETLLLDCMLGEATLFTRSDEAEAAWAVIDPLVSHWESNPPDHFPNYAAGTWGPAVADELIAREGAVWRKPGDTSAGGRGNAAR